MFTKTQQLFKMGPLNYNRGTLVFVKKKGTPKLGCRFCDAVCRNWMGRFRKVVHRKNGCVVFVKRGATFIESLHSSS